MCPPSTDPIRPVGPVAGGTYVGRAELPGRVQRRGREHDAADDDGGGRQHRDGQPDEPHGHVWIGADEREPETGAYDDHGRVDTADEQGPASRRHVDYSA